MAFQIFGVKHLIFNQYKVSATNQTRNVVILLYSFSKLLFRILTNMMTLSAFEIMQGSSDSWKTFCFCRLSEGFKNNCYDFAHQYLVNFICEATSKWILGWSRVIFEHKFLLGILFVMIFFFHCISQCLCEGKLQNTTDHDINPEPQFTQRH